MYLKWDLPHPIRQDFLNGMSFAAIGRKYYIDPRTAKRYVINNLPLEELEKRSFSSVLDPYKDQIDRWLLNGPVFSRTIHDRLIECGCKCGYTIVNDYVQKKILEYEKSNIPDFMVLTVNVLSRDMTPYVKACLDCAMKSVMHGKATET